MPAEELAEEFLVRASDLLESGWCQGASARDAIGEPIDPSSAFARRWSIAGALEQAFVDDLCVYFRRSDFVAERAGGSMIEVYRPDAPSADQERREIELHLRVWRATNPTVRAEIVE